MKKALFGLVAFIVIGIGAFKVYDVYLNYRFREISDNKVYKSGVIPPDKLDDYIAEHNIKSVIDLRGPVTTDTINNPEKPQQIFAEKAVVENLGDVNYFNIPSQQVPSKATLKKFFAVMDHKENYPVLIHCYHGIGRAQVYSALYRIEYENVSNEDARQDAAFPIVFSSFDDGTPKGEFLKNYVKRKDSIRS